jgi:hypothetical protein
MPYDIASFQHVRRYLLPRNISEAEQYLRHRRETAHLMVVYQKYFPQEFPPDWTRDQDKVLPENENTYSAAELNCIRLIEERLFPFALDHLLTCADEGERLSTIPLWPFGIDLWNQPWSDFEPGWQMLLLLIEDAEEAGEDEQVRSIRDILRQAVRSPRSFSLSHLTELCQDEDAPLCYLPIAIRMIEHSTNNAFLDPTDEMPCEDMFWDLDDIALLARHWAEAQTMIEQTNELSDWLAADPQRLRKVVDLWNQAQSTTN